MKKNNSLHLSKSLQTEITSIQPDLLKLEQYLADGADINYQAEEDGYTALMLAVDKDDKGLVKFLLERNADPLIRNQHKEIASDLALTHSPIYLILKNYELLFAAVQNDISKVKGALEAGANINFQGQGGYTALMIAVKESYLELVELLMIRGADLSLICDDRRGAFSLVTDQLIYLTLQTGKPLSKESKQNFWKDTQEQLRDEERLEKGHLKALAKDPNQPFDLLQLKFHPYVGNFEAAPTKSQIAEIEEHFGHPLPARLKDIFIHYNGGRPMLHYYGDNEESSMHYFYALSEDRNSPGNIWWVNNTYLDYLGAETLAFAQDSYGGIFFLKWVNGSAQVWLFQYGDQPFEYEEEEEEDSYKIPTAYTLIADSLDDFLEALYEAED